jgi:hypothetical protein
MHLTCQAISNMKNATVENTQAIARIEGQMEYLVAEVTRIEEEELQGQLMADGHYMIDADDSSNLHHEHDQFEFDLDLVPKQDEALLDSTTEIRLENGETTEISFPTTYSSAAEEEEKAEHLESDAHLGHTAPPPNPNSSNNKEMSIEAHPFITIPLETLHEPQPSILQCLKESSCAKPIKDPYTQGQKSRNRHPKNILRSKQVGYQRRQPILLEGYQILKKKWWKGLVGLPHDRGRCCKFSFPFYFLHI